MEIVAKAISRCFEFYAHYCLTIVTTTKNIRRYQLFFLLVLTFLRQRLIFFENVSRKGRESPLLLLLQFRQRKL